MIRAFALLLLALPLMGASADNPYIPQCGSAIVLPMMATVPGTLTATAMPGTANLVRCTRFRMPCSINATRMGFTITAAGAAGSQCGVGIYDFDTLDAIARTSAGTACSSTGAGSGTGLTINLVAGKQYLACHAASVTATLTMSGSGAANVNYNLGSAVVYDASNTAQFADSCTDVATPYACCEAADTGSTCVGLPANLGTSPVPAASAVAPAIIIAE